MGTHLLHQSVEGKLKFQVGTKSMAVDFTDQRIIPVHFWTIDNRLHYVD